MGTVALVSLTGNTMAMRLFCFPGQITATGSKIRYPQMKSVGTRSSKFRWPTKDEGITGKCHQVTPPLNLAPWYFPRFPQQYVFQQHSPATITRDCPWKTQFPSGFWRPPGFIQNPSYWTSRVIFALRVICHADLTYFISHYIQIIEDQMNHMNVLFGRINTCCSEFLVENAARFSPSVWFWPATSRLRSLSA